ncbi:hypothetical protein PCCS19_16060 [Paenibacillus sp. CCS19]|uniref:hypothetical protein n=1 Tax=Paenibacillus sp. CCS19 TaxID=3158387 RepID=UPI00255D225D|nr:hypothetical protein [Paenibacillus cellulosilyticus]GMK38552.1 hypothetical protein PCCS19_16060 [Paenibacillus cellulosilyticus]
MGKFVFDTDNSTYKFCECIVNRMITSFGLSDEEAVGRINNLWAKLGSILEGDIMFHETPEFWAYDIYYGHDSSWWHRLDDPSLRPIKY